MKRYEREFEEILRRLHYDGMTVAQAMQPDTSKANRAGAFWPPSLRLPIATRPTGATGDAFLVGPCLMLAAALVLLPFMALLSAGLMVVSLALLIVLLKRSRAAREAEDELAANDLRWVDVTVQARQGTSGGPRRP
jgi:hypothetical protein